jgi:hypothetical protein
LPWLKLLVAGYSQRRPGFVTGSFYMGFAVDKLALGRFFSEFFGLPLSVSFHPVSPYSYII